MNLQQIPIGIIDEPSEPHRLGMDEQALGELADSIRLEGLKQPISVRPSSEGRYEIIAGHRRFAACRQIGLVEITAFVRLASEAHAEVERFTENMQREQLTPMEEAVALTRYMESSGLEVAKIAEKLSKTEAWVRTRMQLMGLPDGLKGEVHAGRIAIASALALLKVTNLAHRDYLTRYAVEGGASSAVVRQWVDAWVIHQESGTEEPAPSPTWQPGDTVVIIQIPCATCTTPHDHREMAIIRVCKTCLDQIADAHGR